MENDDVGCAGFFATGFMGFVLGALAVLILVLWTDPMRDFSCTARTVESGQCTTYVLKPKG